MTVATKLLIVLCAVLSAEALVPFIDGGKSMPKLVRKNLGTVVVSVDEHSCACNGLFLNILFFHVLLLLLTV